MKRVSIKDPSASNTTLLSAMAPAEFGQKDTPTHEVIAFINAYSGEFDDGCLFSLRQKFPSVELTQAFSHIALLAQKNSEAAKQAALRIHPYFATAIEGVGLVLKKGMEHAVGLLQKDQLGVNQRR